METSLTPEQIEIIARVTSEYMAYGGGSSLDLTVIESNLMSIDATTFSIKEDICNEDGRTARIEQQLITMNTNIEHQNEVLDKGLTYCQIVLAVILVGFCFNKVFCSG